MADEFNTSDRATGIQVSSDDTTPALLDAKIVAGSGIVLNILNPGANEELEIEASGGGGGGFTPFTMIQSGGGFTLSAASLYAAYFGFTTGQIASFTLPNTTTLPLVDYPLGGYTIVQAASSGVSVSVESGVTMNQGSGLTFSSAIKQVTVVRASATNWIVG